MNASICETCGHEVQPGDWPFCPHAKAATAQVINDTLPGGPRWMHNLGDAPVWVETKSELNTIMTERGLHQSPRNNYNKDDKSPYATRTRLRPGMHDPFLGRR